MSFGLGPRANFSVLVNLDMDHIRSAADRTVFYVFLTLARGEIDGDDDLFAAGIAHVAGFVGRAFGLFAFLFHAILGWDDSIELAVTQIESED